MALQKMEKALMQKFEAANAQLSCDLNSKITDTAKDLKALTFETQELKTLMVEAIQKSLLKTPDPSTNPETSGTNDNSLNSTPIL